MKSPTLLMIGLGLVGAALMPATCRAQSEIDPDHFEMTNVDPIPQPTNIGPEQTQTGVEGRENYDQRCSNFKTLQNGEVKGTHFQFDLLGFSIVIEACNYGEIAHFSNQVQTVERVRKQVGTVLNHFLFGEEAARFRAEPSSNRSNGRPRPFFDRLRWDRPPGR